MAELIPHFNLVDDPWINVSGRPRQSLKTLFSDLSITRFSGNAVEKIVLLRFMLSLAHAAVEIPDRAAWKALTPEILSQKVLAYLEKHHDKFELFGATPFLQFPALKKSQKLQPYSVMLPNVSVGNKTVLTNWNLEPEIAIHDLPLFLLRGICFGMGGKKYDNSLVLTPGYTGKFNDKGKPGSGTFGTLLGFQGYLHSYLLGESLLETVHLNMLTQEDLAEITPWKNKGVPLWEQMPEGEDCLRAKEYKTSYQGTLLPLDKFFLLLPGEKKIAMTDGIAYPTHLTGLIDPALTIYEEKNKMKAVWARTEQRPWRELNAILAFLQATANYRSPYTLSCGIKKMSPQSMIHIWTAGVQVSSNAGEQYISGKNDYIESEFFFPNENLVFFCDRYRNVMESLEERAKILYNCVAGYFKELQNLNGKDIASAAVTYFWEITEKDVPEIIELSFSEEATDTNTPEALLKKWDARVLQCYSEACPFGTARQLMAWSEHKPFVCTKKFEKKG